MIFDICKIMTFVEAIRRYPDIEIAIFYDGVNELGNSIEKHIEPNSPEFLMGRPLRLQNWVRKIMIKRLLLKDLIFIIFFKNL